MQTLFLALGSLLPSANNNSNNNNNNGIEFLDNLGRRMTRETDDNREKAFLYQRLSEVIQRYNAVILDTFARTTTEDEF